MLSLRAALIHIRNTARSLWASGPAFWAVTPLIALPVPSPIAAPVLYVRLRRGPPRRLTAGMP